MEISWGIVISIAFGIVAVVVLLYVLHEVGSRVMGRMVEHVIESLDEHVLGVQVEIEGCKVNPFRGRVLFTDVIVFNPPGFSSEHLMAGKKLFIDIDMCRLIRSFGKTVDIEVLKLEDIEIIIEHTGVLQNHSNINALVEHMDKKVKHALDLPDRIVSKVGDKMSKKFDKVDSKLGLSSKFNEVGSQFNKLTSNFSDTSEAELLEADERKKETKKKTTEPDTVLHKVSLTGISAKVAFSAIGGMGVTLALADIEYEDFEKDQGIVDVAEIFRIILMSLIDSVLTTIAGKNIVEGIKDSRMCQRVC